VGLLQLKVHPSGLISLRNLQISVLLELIQMKKRNKEASGQILDHIFIVV